MDQIIIEAQPRTALGKKVRALRRAGITPIHVYGRDTPSESLQADTPTLIHALNEAGFTTPITVKIGTEEHFAVVKTIQRHPVTERLLHVDLITISRTQRMTAAVPLHFEGEALGAREEGAQVYEDLHELEVEALPLEMPHLLTIDLSVLATIDAVIHAADIELPANITLVTDPSAPIARIVMRRPAEEAGEAPIGAVAEGEAAVAAPAQQGPSATKPEAQGGEAKE